MMNILNQNRRTGEKLP